MRSVCDNGHVLKFSYRSNIFSCGCRVSVCNTIIVRQLEMEDAVNSIPLGLSKERAPFDKPAGRRKVVGETPGTRKQVELAPTIKQ